VIAVSGIVGEHRGSPQIVIDRPALLEVLTDSRIVDLLGSSWNGKPPPVTISRDLSVGDVVEHSAFGQGVVVRVMGDVAEVRFAAGVKQIAFKSYPLRFVHRPAQRRATSARTQAAAGISRPNSVARPPGFQSFGTPASGFSSHQTEWSQLIAASSSSVSQRRLGRAGATPSVSGTSPTSPIPVPARWTNVKRRRVFVPATLSAGAFLAALAVAPMNNVAAIGLGVVALATGIIAAGRMR
jgi:hypothetical protein